MAPKARPLPTAEEIGTLVPIGRIAPQTPYSADFLRQLARNGKIRAFKLNRDWLTTPDAIREYLRSQKQRHEKAARLLQTAEKAFLALTLLLVVFSVTPEASAQGQSNPPPATVAISAMIHDAVAGWQNLGSFYAQLLSQLPSQIKTAALWQQQENRAVLLSLGQALLGKSIDEYLAVPAIPHFQWAAAPSQSRVLGISTTKKPARVAANKYAAAISASDVNAIVQQLLQQYIGRGLLPGPKGDKSDPDVSRNTGLVNNDNGKTTAIIGGNPIVSYYPAAPANNFSGASVSGFTNLSSNSFNTGSAVVQNTLSVQGSSSFASGSFSGPLTAATSTVSSLTVSGPATFTGSTTIAGLTVTGLNPGLTLGSIAFQGASGLTQDNALFYDSTNHRLGLGTTTPSQLLTVAGNAVITGNATTTGNQIISGALNVSGVSTLATTTATSLTDSGSALITGSTTISSLIAGPVRSTSSGSLYTGAVNLSSTDVSGILQVSNGGFGALTLSQYALLAGNGSSAIATITPGTTFQVLRSAGSSAYPVYSDIGSLLTAGSNIAITGTSTIAVAGSPSFTGTTSVATLTTTGNVGIGTTSPAVLLHVSGTNTRIRIQDTSIADNNQIMDIGYKSGVFEFAKRQGSTGTKIADSLVLDYANDRVGINAFAPGSTLTVSGDAVVGVDYNAIAAPVNGLIVEGNVGIGTTTPTLGPLTMASGAYVTSGGVWTNASDRTLKENFATMSPASILQNIDQLPITQWNYKNEDVSIKHIGPVAQDFYSLFHVGNSDKSISTIDPSGIALLGIQALDTKITALQGSLTGNATTTGQLTVYSPANFSCDSVGQAQIKPGASSVRVTFHQPYQYQPIVTATIIGTPQATFYSIDNIDATGFTIKITSSTPGFVTSEGVTFDWHSFASPAEQLTVSDGTTLPIQLIVATSPAGGSQASAPLTVSPTPAPQAQTQPNTSSSTPQVLGVSTTTPSSDASTSASSAQSFASTPSTTTQSSSPAPSTVQTLTPPVIAPTPAASPTPAPAAVPQPSSPAPTPAPGAPAETSSPAAAAVTPPPAVPATQPSTTTDQKAASAQ